MLDVLTFESNICFRYVEETLATHSFFTQYSANPKFLLLICMNLCTSVLLHVCVASALVWDVSFSIRQKPLVVCPILSNNAAAIVLKHRSMLGFLQFI